jgi:hypothetical protein
LPIPAVAATAFHFVEQGFEQSFTLALGAKVQIVCRVRQRQQLGNQLVLIGIRALEQLAQLGPLCLTFIIACETSGTFELNDCGVERAVLMMRRAEPAQTRAWLVLGRLVYGGGQARLADAGLTGEKHHLTLATLGFRPAPQKQVEFLIPSNESG